VQDMLQGIGRPGKTWHDMLEILNRQDMDQAMVQFLRAVTARELWANKLKYNWCIGGDVYRCALSLAAMSCMLWCVQACMFPALGSTPIACDHQMHMLLPKLQNKQHLHMHMILLDCGIGKWTCCFQSCRMSSICTCI